MTMNDYRGYSHAMVEEVRAADPTHYGVQLGLHCIENKIPAHLMAKRIGVSRLTIYHWFKGKFKPRNEHIEKIKEVLAEGKEPAV